MQDNVVLVAVDQASFHFDKPVSYTHLDVYKRQAHGQYHQADDGAAGYGERGP